RRSYVFNLCKNRYHFAVAFTAALARRQINLLPASEAPQVLRDIARRYPDVYCLTDQRECPSDLEVYRYPQDSDSFGEPPSPPAFAGDQVAAIVFTSGSTGEPSANVKTWAQLMAETNMAMRRFWGARDCPASVVGTVVPQHMYGLETTFLLPLRSGFGFHAGRPLFPEDIRAALEAVRAPRILVTTPLHIRACVAERTRLPDVVFILSATAPLSPGLARQAETMFQTEVLEIYGCSETGSIATRRTVEGNLWRSYDEMSLFRQGERCFVCGPSVSEPVELNDVIQLRNSHEFSLHGRLADLINIAGKRSSLADLNHKLNEIEGVQDGVFFMPDEVPDRMSRLIAFVVAPGLSKDDVVRALRERIDAVFLPRPLYMVDALPRTQNGKLPRARLTEFAATLAAGRKEAESV
ncbi:MAG: AMP-binding protein, partial [Acidiferrobacterales bacterium]|nr:AMP-binding protein [Acidiferrobacterales bacterium]